MFLRAADADRDGKITKAELAKAVEQFDRFDRNGDGSLDSREISGLPGGFTPGGGPDRPNANRNQPPNVGQFVNGMLERYDSDKDGKISGQELSDVPNRTKERFTEWDADKDGSITKEEITAAMKDAFERNARESDRPRTRPERPKTDE
jgi:Ca2+-binding EF-hand superfamily protein